MPAQDVHKPYARHKHHLLITYSNQRYTPDKSHTGLQNNAQNTTRVLRQNGVHAVPLGVDNANGLRAYLNRYGDSVTHVVIQAIWMKQGDIRALCTAFPAIEFAVVVHSGFAFLEDELAAIPLLYQTMDLAQQVPNLIVCSNSSGMCADLSAERGQPTTWLPNLYPTDFINAAPNIWRGGNLRIGLFCAPRPKKNMVNQAAAAGIICRRLKTQGTLFYNEGRQDGGPSSPAKRIIQGMKNAIAGNPYITAQGIKWQSMPEHIQTVSSMNINLQCSNSETHNLVVCDAIAAGIPTVASSAIKLVPAYWQADPDSASDIARVAVSLLYNPQAPFDGIAALQQFNAQGLYAWMRYVAQGVSGVGANAWPNGAQPLESQRGRHSGSSQGRL